MNIGDKVRFLNSTGGGTVKSFRGKDIVLVEDQDGFDIPVLIRECVVIETNNDTQVRKQTKVEIEIPKAEKPVVIPDMKVVETKEGEQLTVCLSYLPIDIKTLSTTDFECYLINDSNYFLSYSYLSFAPEGWICRSYGVIDPNTKLFLEEFERTQLNEMERVCLQFIAFKKEKSFDLKNTCSVEIRIDTVKFYKLHSFKENDYFDDYALIYPIIRKDITQKEMPIDVGHLQASMMEKTIERRPEKQLIERKPKASILEVDLHIYELLDSTSGLSSADILKYQLEKFNEVMQENAKKRGQKIIFIHGKGDGVLKSSLIKELKTKYKSVYFQDASFQEYGYGATMITIK